MRWLDNLKVSRKLLVGFGAVVSVIVVSSTLVVLQTFDTAKIVRKNSASDAAIDYVDQLRGDLEAERSSMRKFVITDADADRKAVDSSREEGVRDADATRHILTKEAPELLPELDAYIAALHVYDANTIARYVDLAAVDETRPQVIDLLKTNAAASERQRLNDTFEALRRDTAAWSNKWTLHAIASTHRTIGVVVAGGIVSALLGALMAFLIDRAISLPITSMTTLMRRLAHGDNHVEVTGRDRSDEIGQMAITVQVFKDAAMEKLHLEEQAAETRAAAEQERRRSAALQAETSERQAEVVNGLASGLSRLASGDLLHRLNSPFAGEYEALRADFNAAMEKMQGAISEVAAKSSAIRSGTGEISAASIDLSRRTEQQAASLEETAAALDEITATVKKTADGSIGAKAAVEAAQKDAVSSGEVVSRAIQAIGRIQQSSQQIGQIIVMMDEIAFQTNLLSLNAGVEAARAGEAGRGFAVVASEVRALAQRSATAAKEIKTLITTSEHQVEDGVKLVGEAGSALGRIVEQVAAIHRNVMEISESAQEQAAGLSQINTAVNQMDQVTQQNAAMVEESTAATKNLEQEISELLGLISHFDVGAQLEWSKPLTAAPKALARPVAATPAPAAAAPIAVPVSAPRERVPAPVGDWEEF